MLTNYICCLFRWYWCEKHNVQLPDEYDQIYRDLEPFWGIDPVDLKLMQSQHESHLDSYTIGKDRIADPLSLLKVSFSYHGEGTSDKAHRSQAWEMIDTLKEVQEFIPPFRAVFSPHDNPNLFTDWEVRTQMVKAAAVRKCASFASRLTARDCEVTNDGVWTTCRCRRIETTRSEAEWVARRL